MVRISFYINKGKHGCEYYLFINLLLNLNQETKDQFFIKCTSIRIIGSMIHE